MATSRRVPGREKWTCAAAGEAIASGVAGVTVFGMKRTTFAALAGLCLSLLAPVPAAVAEPASDPGAPFAECVKTHGVSAALPKTPPAPPPGFAGKFPPAPSADKAPPAPTGVEAATWSAAWSACWSLAPKPPTS